MTLTEKILKEAHEGRSAAIIILKDNKALILKRGSTAPWMPNKWNFPGGEVHEDETPLEGAVRETIEEAGIKITNAQLYQQNGSMYFFIGSTTQNENISWESSDSYWVSKNELDKFDFVTDCKKLLSKILK